MRQLTFPPVRAANDEPRQASLARSPSRKRSLKEILVLAVAFACGAMMGLSVELVGNLLLGEPLLVAAAGLLLIRGIGPHADRKTFVLYGILGLVMLVGYAAADLVSNTEPWQYLRGWARVSALVLTSLALIVLTSHFPRSLWWFALGIGLGTAAVLAAEGVPLQQWKIGYAEPAILVLLAVGGRVSLTLTSVLVLGFGLLCIGLDYRSLGAVAVLISASLVWRVWIGRRSQWRVRDVVAMAFVAIAALAALVLALELTRSDYDGRRVMSNLGRYVGLAVAAQAIADSPILGHGSWAADREYLSRIRMEEQRASFEAGKPVRVGDSLMPHSQILQVWVEGGVLAAVFFLVYGWHVLVSWWWLMRGHRPDPLTPLYLFAIYEGAWNWFASPATGFHRLYIALAIATIAILAQGREGNRRRSQPAGAMMAPGGGARRIYPS